MIEFNGEQFHDDRLYTFYVCKVTTSVEGGMREITLHHVDAPEEHMWGLVLYRNSGRMMPAKVYFFDSKEEAVRQYTKLAPQVPRISLNGKAPELPSTFKDYADWMSRNGISEYDYESFYPGGGSNPKETIYEKIQEGPL